MAASICRARPPEPSSAVASGALVLAEPVTIFIVLGGLLMLVGVAAAQFGPGLLSRR